LFAATKMIACNTYFIDMKHARSIALLLMLF